MMRAHFLFLTICFICVNHIYAREYNKTVTIHPTVTVIVNDDKVPTPSVDIVDVVDVVDIAQADASGKKFFKHTTLPNLSRPDVEIPTKPGEVVKITPSPTPTPAAGGGGSPSNSPSSSLLPTASASDSNKIHSSLNKYSEVAKPTNGVKVQPDKNQPKTSFAMHNAVIPSWIQYIGLALFAFIQFTHN
ncbi:hypothetical protein BJ944DRAFT_232257 [Cunninghamella echinulata]|nr:hypothetical protein BJ944DRAFT_232257 [Cunninghamella echinulata]